MECPVCKIGETEVKDSRPGREGEVRRRRKCRGCNHRFTTYEARMEDFHPRQMRERLETIETHLAAMTPAFDSIRETARGLRELLEEMPQP